MFATLRMRMLQVVLAVVVSAMCLALLAIHTTPAQAAEQDVQSVTAQPCADTGAEDGTEAALAACILRLRQPLVDTKSPFGNTHRLSQTFVSPKTTGVCAVRALVLKTVANNDPLFMQIQTFAGAPLAQAVIPAGPLPVGVPTWVTFNFGCAGGALVQGVTYRLEIFAPQSPDGRFYWMRHDASVIAGQGFQRIFPGANVPIAPLGTDFTFLLYMCS